MTQPTTAPRRPRTTRPKLDAVAADAVELAREALLEVTEPGQVGDHQRVEVSGERLVTHVFECTMPGYRGWSWVVVLARAPRAKAPTVAETALLPGEDAILAPEWEPWSERLKPEDIGNDDLLPYHEQDARLEQGYEATGDEDADRVALWELGLGRPRVLSPLGRAEAAERWMEGDFGPRQISGRGRKGTVSASCSSCGFLSKLSGSLRGEFGVCTNEWSPADGRVVHLGFGCGAHSETGQQDDDREISRGAGVVVDELDVEIQPKPESGEPADVVTPADGAMASGGENGSDGATAVDAADADAPAETVAEVPEADSPQDEVPAQVSVPAAAPTEAVGAPTEAVGVPTEVAESPSEAAGALTEVAGASTEAVESPSTTPELSGEITAEIPEADASMDAAAPEVTGTEGQPAEGEPEPAQDASDESRPAPGTTDDGTPDEAPSPQDGEDSTSQADEDPAPQDGADPTPQP
ncbi:DUF3027 domain-containing protein [Brachybacterium fresconis]|uniref:DUF3027 domain-containing protein n=1 Tax=Brachybacterium fresconis TaxID=173363 RepID=A0ABS4YJR5_9MICO|nr:hypothetical protein [Brachybacterium fresconis]